MNDVLARLRDADQALDAMHPTPFPLPIAGEEAVIAGAVLGLARGDWWVPGARERVGAVLRDVPLDRVVDAFAGAKPYKIAPPTPAPALRALHAVGIGIADPDRAVLVHLGIGSVADGAFAEALNLAALHRPRVLFLVSVLAFGDDAPIGPQSAATPEALATAYGIPVTTVPRTDAEAVRAAVVAARDAGGPHVIVAR